MKLNILLLTISLHCLFNSVGNAETTLHISTGFTPPVSDFFNRVLTEADRRIESIAISFEILPAERSLVLANQGINDGECCRIPEVIASEYPNLIHTNISFFAARFSAFSKRRDLKLSSFTDLKPYSVGSIKGWKIAVNKIQEAQPREVHIVTKPEQLFQMLKQERIDVGVMGYLSGLKSISQLQIDDIYAIDPPLIEKPLYLFLHKKHKTILPELNRTLREMVSDGTVDTIYKDLIQSLQKETSN